MTRHTRFAKFLFLTLGLGMCFSPLFAQDATPVYKAKVTLPFETRWGNAILPAGEYSLFVRSSTLPALVTVRGKHASAMITAQSLSKQTDSDGNSFLLIGKWRRGVVRSLYVSDLGMAFNYAVPREETKEMTEEAVLIQRLPVTKAKN